MKKSEQTVYELLKNSELYRDEKGIYTIFPQEYLIKRLGKDERTVRRALKSLEEQNLIRREWLANEHIMLFYFPKEDFSERHIYDGTENNDNFVMKKISTQNVITKNVPHYSEITQADSENVPHYSEITPADSENVPHYSENTQADSENVPHYSEITQADSENCRHYSDITQAELSGGLTNDSCKNEQGRNSEQNSQNASSENSQNKEIPHTKPVEMNGIFLPLDKVTFTLWNHFPIGQVKKLKAESDKDSKKGKQANILLLLDFKALNGVNIGRELTVYDKWVWNACANLKIQGHDVITVEQIYTAMGNDGRPNPQIKEKILESVETVSCARVSIDNTEEHELYPKYDRFKATFPLLATEICAAYCRGQMVDDAIRILDDPKLFLFAQERKQITKLPLSLLESPLSKTDDNLILADYLLTRISKMRNSKYITRKILLYTVQEKCEVDTYKQKQRLPEKIERILSHCKETEWIKDYKITDEEIEIVTY